MPYEPYQDELTQLTDIITKQLVDLADPYEIMDTYDNETNATINIHKFVENGLHDDPQSVLDALDSVRLDPFEEPHEKTTFVESLMETIRQEYMPDDEPNKSTTNNGKDLTPIPVAPKPKPIEQPECDYGI